MENISEKYAVYTNSGSDPKDVLAVVVDSHDQAKAELEKFKGSAACVTIKKSKVENFGKEGERVTESSEVECWRKQNEGSEKLSGFQKSSDTIVAASGGDTQVVSSTPIVSAFQKNADIFYEYYSNSGDLLGLGFGFFGDAQKNVEQSVAIPPAINAGGESSLTQPSPQAQPPVIATTNNNEPVVSAEKKVDGATVDGNIEIKNLATEVSQLKEKINELIVQKKDTDKN